MKKVLIGVGLAVAGFLLWMVLAALFVSNGQADPKYVQVYVDATKDSDSTSLQVHNCTDVKEIRMYEGDKLVAGGGVIEMPPYLCRFVWASK